MSGPGVPIKSSAYTITTLVVVPASRIVIVIAATGILFALSFIFSSFISELPRFAIKIVIESNFLSFTRSNLLKIIIAYEDYYSFSRLFFLRYYFFFQRQGQVRLLIDEYESGNLIFSSGLPHRIIVYLIESSWRTVHLLKPGDERYWRSFCKSE